MFDELKTHQRGAGMILRSRKPELVEQEIWGLLLTHYGIRHLMREAADQAELDPDRMSFIRTLRVIRRQVTGQAAFSPSEDSTKAVREAIEEITERPNPASPGAHLPPRSETHAPYGFPDEAARPGKHFTRLAADDPPVPSCSLIQRHCAIALS